MIPFYIIEDLFDEIKGTDNSVKLEYGVGDYYLIQSYFEIDGDNEPYIEIRGYEYLGTKKKPVKSILNLQDIRSVHVISVNEDLKRIRDNFRSYFKDF